METPHHRLRGLIAGYQVSQAIAAAVTLGIPEQLADGPRAAGDVAASLSLDGGLLHRLMWALAAAEVLTTTDGTVFRLSDMGQHLLPAAPQSLAHRARLMCSPFIWDAWKAFPSALASGGNAFASAHGTDYWSYLDHHPQAGAVFDAAMSADAGWMGESLAQAFDFGRFTQVIDIGGGEGRLIEGILRQYPALRGTLFDKDEVIRKSGIRLAPSGLKDRLSIVAGDFFDSVPQGGDVHVLKWVLHDWPDDDAIRILRNCRAALPAHGRILIAEHAMDDRHPTLSASLIDLTMFVVTGGRERTCGDYETLLRAAGCRLLNVIETDCKLQILEAAASD